MSNIYLALLSLLIIAIVRFVWVYTNTLRFDYSNTHKIHKLSWEMRNADKTIENLHYSIQREKRRAEYYKQKNKWLRKQLKEIKETIK